VKTILQPTESFDHYAIDPLLQCDQAVSLQ